MLNSSVLSVYPRGLAVKGRGRVQGEEGGYRVRASLSARIVLYVG